MKKCAVSIQPPMLIGFIIPNSNNVRVTELFVDSYFMADICVTFRTCLENKHTRKARPERSPSPVVRPDQRLT